MSELPPSVPVFYDPAGRRRRNLNRLAAALGAGALLAGAALLTALWHPAALPALHLGDRTPGLRPLTGVVQHAGRAAAGPDESYAGVTGDASTRAAPLNVTGFFVAWDDNSLSSLKRNLGTLDVLVPELAAALLEAR